MLLLLASFAHAEEAGVLPRGATVVYGGPAVMTYGTLQTGPGSGGGALDRGLIARLDLYGARALSDRVQLSAYVPVIYSTVIDDDTLGPCPTGQDCTPIAGIGAAGLQIRVAAVTSPLLVTFALGVSSGAWNRDVRGRYTMVGEASTDLVPGVYLGRKGKFGGFDVAVVGFGAYAFRVTTYPNDVPVEAPPDDIRAGLELQVTRGPVSAMGGAYTLQRLGGSAFREYGGAQDQWAAADYDNVAIGGKISVGLPNSMGIHLGVSRVLWVNNGLSDAVDASLGVHKYFAPSPASVP